MDKNKTQRKVFTFDLILGCVTSSSYSVESGFKGRHQTAFPVHTGFCS